jgi:hypothetical protein
MKSSIGEHDRMMLEAYLHDLIWDAKKPEERDVLVQALTSLQHSRARTASNSA